MLCILTHSTLFEHNARVRTQYTTVNNFYLRCGCYTRDTSTPKRRVVATRLSVARKREKVPTCTRRVHLRRLSDDDRALGCATRPREIDTLSVRVTTAEAIR